MKSFYLKKAAFILVAAIAAIAAAVPAVAQSGDGVMTLSADDAVKLALVNNEGLKQASIALETKRRAAGVSWNAFIPSITAGAGVTQANSSVMSADSSSVTSAEVPLSVSLSLPGSVPQLIELTKLSYEGQRISWEQTKQSLSLSVRKRFYTILLDQANLELARQNVTRQTESYTQTESRYRAGLASELDYLKAKVSLETLKPKVQGYATTLQNDIDSFKKTLGLKDEDVVEVKGSLELTDGVIDRTVSDALKQDSWMNLAVASASNALAVATAAKTELFNANYLPSLVLSGSVTGTYPVASSRSSFSSSVNTSLSALVSVSLDNYMPWSSAHEKVSAAADTVEEDRSALADSVKTTQVARMSDKRSVENYLSTLGVLKLNVDLTSRTYDAAKAAYDKGLETMTDLLGSAGDLESAQLDTLSKSYDLIAALLDLQYETGLPLDTTGRF